jgi:hypothetical protein
MHVVCSTELADGQRGMGPEGKRLHIQSVVPRMCSLAEGKRLHIQSVVPRMCSLVEGKRLHIQSVVPRMCSLAEGKRLHIPACGRHIKPLC